MIVPDIHRLAMRDVERAYAKLAEKSERLADDMFADFRRTVAKLQSSPYLYGEEADGMRHRPFETFSYSLLYQILPDRIWISAVSHHHRKPRYWSRRRPFRN